MINRKEKWVKYVEGSFTDFNNKKHSFVVCARLTEGIVIANSTPVVTRTLVFGVALCSTTDTYNPELGKKIAYGKAVACRDNNLITGRAGLLNITNATSILQNEVKHVMEFPELYSKKYRIDKEKFLKKNESVNKQEPSDK